MSTTLDPIRIWDDYVLAHPQKFLKIWLKYGIYPQKSRGHPVSKVLQLRLGLEQNGVCTNLGVTNNWISDMVMVPITSICFTFKFHTAGHQKKTNSWSAIFSHFPIGWVFFFFFRNHQWLIMASATAAAPCPRPSSCPPRRPHRHPLLWRCDSTPSLGSAKQPAKPGPTQRQQRPKPNRSAAVFSTHPKSCRIFCYCENEEFSFMDFLKILFKYILPIHHDCPNLLESPTCQSPVMAIYSRCHDILAAEKWLQPFEWMRYNLLLG